MESLYNKYGGFETVSKVVHSFYDKVLVSDTFKPYFEDVDTQRVIDHQTKFFCDIMGGPVAFEGKTLAEIHVGMEIKDSAYAELSELLEETLEDHGLDDTDVKTLLTIVDDVKDQIVGR
ncbi:MAG: group 1 truncated hemoglobin [Cycloclasticus sp.]